MMHWLRSSLAALSVAAMIVSAGGCVPRPSVPDDKALSPAELWHSSIERDIEAGPAVITGSVRFGTAGETTRASFLWKSNGLLPASVILTDPLGSIVARIDVSEEASLVFVPSENTVYRYGKDEKQFGLPYGYAELASLLAGDYFAFLGSPRQKTLLSQNEAEVSWSFTGDKGRGVLHISRSGVLSVEKDGWKLEINERDGMPAKLDASKEDYRFVMMIRERTASNAFAPDEFAMP